VVPEMGNETKQLFLRKYKDAVEAGFTPESQLKAMELEDIDQAVLFPTQGLFAVAQDDLDPKFATAISRAYNNWLKKKSSEYFMRQCYIGCEAGEEMLPQVVQRIGDERIVFASDYPHPDAKFPDTVRLTLALDDLSDDSKRKIMRDNAKKLYNL
jgi:predicted TIM-barrel fold metal-dependent hydrolase